MGALSAHRSGSGFLKELHRHAALVVFRMPFGRMPFANASPRQLLTRFVPLRSNLHPTRSASLTKETQASSHEQRDSYRRNAYEKLLTNAIADLDSASECATR
jgi:hypothetical protein